MRYKFLELKFFNATFKKAIQLLKKKSSFSFFLIILIISMMKYLKGYEDVVDISGHDESVFYLRQSIESSISNWNSVYSPFYNLWYMIHSFSSIDLVKLHYIAQKNLLILIAVLSYFLFCELGFSRILACVFSIFLNTSNILVLSMPKVTIFHLITLLMALIVLIRTQSNVLGWINSLLIIFLGYYIRPESIHTFYIFGIIGLVYFLFYREIKIQFKYDYHFLILMFLLIILLITSIILWPISFSSMNERSYLAFSQHFNLNNAKWNKLPELWGNEKKTIEEYFGNASSIFEAFINNPGAVYNHLKENLYNFFAILPYFFEKAFIFLNPTKYENLYLEYFLFFVIILLIGRKGVKSSLKKNILFFTLILSFIFPYLISSLLVFPRIHLIAVIEFIFLFSFILFFFHNRTSLKIKLNSINILIFGIIIFGLTPNIKTASIAVNNSVDLTRTKKQINFINKYLERKNNVILATPHEYYKVYIRNNHTFYEFRDTKSFYESIINKQIDIIILDESLLNQYGIHEPNLGQANSIGRFKEYLEKNEFKLIYQAGSFSYLYVNKRMEEDIK